MQKTLKLNAVLTRFLRDTRGATAVEYVLIATVIGVGIIVGVRAMSDSLNGLFNNANDAFTQ
jgi:pilus assembly protein Flp/PilA